MTKKKPRRSLTIDEDLMPLITRFRRYTGMTLKEAVNFLIRLALAKEKE